MKMSHNTKLFILACLLSLMACPPLNAEEGSAPTAWAVKVEKADKSREGTYQPFIIRVRGLPDMTEEELKTFVIEIQGIQMHLEKHADGFYYIKGNSLWVLSARKDKATGKVLVRLWNDVNGNEVIDEGELTDAELELDKLTSKLIRKTQAGDVPLIIDEKRIGSFDVEIENPAGVTIREEDKDRIDGLLFVNYDADENPDALASPPDGETEIPSDFETTDTDVTNDDDFGTMTVRFKDWVRDGYFQLVLEDDGHERLTIYEDVDGTLSAVNFRDDGGTTGSYRWKVEYPLREKKEFSFRYEASKPGKAVFRLRYYRKKTPDGTDGTFDTDTYVKVDQQEKIICAGIEVLLSFDDGPKVAMLVSKTTASAIDHGQGVLVATFHDTNKHSVEKLTKYLDEIIQGTGSKGIPPSGVWFVDLPERLTELLKIKARDKNGQGNFNAKGFTE